MRVTTASDVLNWKPDMSDLGHVSSLASKTEKGRRADLRDYTTQVWIVQIVNVYDDQVFVARIAGKQSDVDKAAYELLDTFCRRFPGSFLKYTMTNARD